jgi:hypothetical protein
LRQSIELHSLTLLGYCLAKAGQTNMTLKQADSFQR